MKHIETTSKFRRGTRRTKRCHHQTTVAVVSAGVERVICSSCGHLSFRYVGHLTRQPEPALFASIRTD
jgi:ribosomal protein L32